MVWTWGGLGQPAVRRKGAQQLGRPGRLGARLGESAAGRGPRTQRPPPAALQELEPQQLLLFVQSFGIPGPSMSKLLRFLDRAVALDPQALEQSVMDKSERRPPRTRLPVLRSLGRRGRPGRAPCPDPRCPRRLHGAPGGGPARARGVRRPDFPLPAHRLPAHPARYLTPP